MKKMSKNKNYLFPVLREHDSLHPFKKEYISPRQDLTFQVIENMSIDGGSFHQSLLNGSLLRETKFVKTDFSRCDFESVRIENCEFVDCNFKTVQFRATDIGKSNFIDCNFEGATIVDIRLTHSSFINCSFKSSFSRDCNYETVCMENCILTKSNTILNSYSHCSFVQITFGDCTFLLHIFNDCEFNACAINADSVGQIYGISRVQIETFNLVFLGELQRIEDSNSILDDIVAQYQARNWVLPLAFLSLNFGLTNTTHILSEVSKYLNIQIKKSWPIKRDEVLFLIRIIDVLIDKEKIPLHSLSTFMEELFAMNNHVTSKSNEEILDFLTRELFLFLQRMLLSLSPYLLATEPLKTDLRVKARITLKLKPNESVSSTLTKVGKLSGFPIKENSKTIECHSGSYVELIWTTINTLLGLQIALYCVEGILVRITRIRARMEVLSGKKLPSTYRLEALSTKDPLQPILMNAIKKIISNTKMLSTNESNTNKIFSESIDKIIIEEE